MRCHCVSLNNENKLHHLINSIGIRTAASHSVKVVSCTSDNLAE